ncbi:integrase [Prochlorococcus phage P-SCSP2]|nr:integrase [Prochlorococcus phage P-SCSP2]
MKKTIPTLSEATRIVYKRQYNGTDSAKNFLTAMNHNIQAIGDIRVDKITTPVVNKMMDYLLLKLKNSKAVVNTKRGYLKTVLDHMIDDGYIDKVRLPKRHRIKKQKVEYLTKDMEIELLNYLIDNEHREAKDIVECLIDLGCRVSELLGLEKRYVDFDNNQINFNERKNDNAVAVPMTYRVRDILTYHCYDLKDFDRVFSLEYDQLNGIWQEARKSLGYADKKFYTLHLCRHTTASRLVQRGVPLLLVKDWLGHEDIKTTMIYAHLAPKALHSVVEVLN